MLYLNTTISKRMEKY